MALRIRIAQSSGMWVPHFSKMYIGHWEPLGVSESCRTRIPGWSNPRDYWTDAVVFRCTWEHPGVPSTSQETPGSASWKPESADHKPGSAYLKPGSTLNDCRAVWENIFGNAPGAPWHRSYYLLFNGCYNWYIQFIFSAMYLYSYPTTHGMSGQAAGGACEQVEAHLKMTIEWTQKYTQRLWSSKFGDALGGRDRVNSEKHLEAMIERVWRCNSIQWLSELRATLRGSDCLSSEMHLEAMIERVLGCTLSPRSSELRDALGGHD